MFHFAEHTINRVPAIITACFGVARASGWNDRCARKIIGPLCSCGRKKRLLCRVSLFGLRFCKKEFNETTRCPLLRMSGLRQGDNAIEIKQSLKWPLFFQLSIKIVHLMWKNWFWNLHAFHCILVLSTLRDSFGNYCFIIWCLRQQTGSCRRFDGPGYGFCCCL